MKNKLSEKKGNSVIAAILSFMIWGTGQMYKGETKKGLSLVIADLAFSFVVGMSIYFSSQLAAINKPFLPLMEPVIIAKTVGYLVIWIWNVYDAYKA